MIRWLPVLLAISTLLSTASFAADNKTLAKEPSSEIPAKREFPVNPNVSPCEDFHKYVCADVEASFKLREDRSHHTFAFSDSAERLLSAKKDFMKTLPEEKSLTPRAQQIKDYYMGCMDTDLRAKEEKAKLAQVEKDLKKITKAKDFVKYLNAQTYNGDYNFINFYPGANLDNPLKLDMDLGARLMDLPDHAYYEKADVMAAYKELFIKFFMTADPTLSKEQAATKADQQIQLQKDFAKIYPVASVRRQRWSEKRQATQEDTLKKYPNLQLNAFTSKLPKSTLVSTPIPEALQFLNDNLTDEKLPIMKDFYLYKVGSDLMDEAYPEFFSAQFDFEKKFFGGPQVRPDLQERCTTSTGGSFMMELDQVLTDRLFPGFKDEKVQALAETIRTSILTGLNKNTWLSVDAKAEAMKKIKTARLQLVRPHTDKEWDWVPTQKYSKKMYLGNMEIRRKARLQKSIDDFRHPANQDAWGMGPLIVNAYYSENENKFVLPIGILQYPFYDKDGDMIENLGAVGAVMGHELGHSIDDQGAKYDDTGKLHQWMSMKEVAEFETRGKKMIAQMDKAGINGALTQGENIADLVGVTFAYNAAFPDGKASVEDKKRFFVSYGRLWCTVIRPDFAQMLLKTDPHSPGWARINEQVKQQPAFAEAFQCKSNDKMVLSDKDRVQIW